MKVFSRVVRLRTYGPMRFFDITPAAAEIAQRCSGEGVLRVFSKGSTSALVLAPPGILDELSAVLSKLIPVEGWRHGNAYAHLRSVVLSTVRYIPVERGRLLIPDGYRLYFLETRPVLNHWREVVTELFCSSR